MRKISSFSHFVMLSAVVAAIFMASCIKDEVVDVPFIPTESETIGFGVASDWGEYEDVTRSGVALNRIGKHELKSADSEFSLPMAIYEEEGIHTLGAETRGAKISSLTEFTAWAKLAYGDNKVMSYFAEETFTGTMGQIYSCGTKYYWPGAGSLSFVTLGNTPDSGLELAYDAEGILPTGFTYTVPADATAQKDIVVGATYDGDALATTIPGDYGQSVNLKFGHVMSAVNVKVGSLPSQGGTFDSITIKNVYNGGTYDIVSGIWTRSGTKGDFVVSDESFTPTTGQTVNAGESTLMMLPQVLPDDAIIEVVFTHSGSTTTTLTASISKRDGQTTNLEWKKNMTTTYVISIDENFNLSVTPQGNVLDAHYIMTTATVDVTELASGQQWYVKVSAEGIPTDGEDVSILKNDENVNEYVKTGYWINSLDGDTEAVRGSKQITGTTTGKCEAIIFIPENISSGDRKITIEYGIVGNEANAKFEYLYQKCPYWDTTNLWGWEKVDDLQSDKYGFDWTRKACYMFAYKIGGWQDSASGSTIYSEDWIRSLIGELVTTYGAEEFVTIDTFTHYDYGTHIGSWFSKEWHTDGSRVAVIIDYTLLNFDDAMSPTDGLANTKAFFDARSLLAFEEALSTFKKYGENGNAFRMLDTAYEEGTTTSEYTSDKFYFDNYEYTDPTTGSTTKKMFREFGEADDASGILKYIIQRNAYDIVSYTLDNGSQGTTLDMNAEKIKWYLPAYGQFTNYEGFEFAAGTATFVPKDFWSSTAAVNNQAYTGEGVAIDRSEKRKVIVQRAVTEIPQAVAVTVDNSEMAGGENGEAQWVN